MKPLLLLLVLGLVVGGAYYLGTTGSGGEGEVTPLATGGADAPAAPAPTPRRVETPIAGTAPAESPERRGASAVSFVLKLVDIDERGVADARVGTLKGGRLEPLGTTGSDGTLRVELDATQGVRLRCEHPEHATATVPVASEPPDEVVVLMPPGAVLRGRVELVEPRPLPPDLRVVVWDTSDPLPRRAWEHEFGEGDPRVRTARVNKDGSFAVGGLQIERFYQVRAGGGGYAMTEESSVVRPNSANVTLALAPLYGLRVRLAEPGGGRLRTSPALEATAGPTWTSTHAHARPLQERLRAIDLMLAGVRADATPDRDLIVFASLRHVHELDGTTYRTRVPGYAPLAAELSLPRLTGEPAERVLELEPLASSWGTLTVQFTGTPPGLPRIARGGFGRPSLVLTREGEHSTISFESFEEQSFQVPHGDYQTRFTAGNGMFTWPAGGQPMPVTIGAEPERIEVDWNGTGALAFELEDEQGIPYHGSALARLIGVSQSGMRIIELAGPPFVVVGVAPGRYSLEAILGLDFPRPGKSPYRAEVEIESGVLERARVTRRVE